MFLLNIKMMTRQGVPISLPWLRAAFMLNGVQVQLSAVKNRAEGDVFTAELRRPLTLDALECLAESLNLTHVSYYSDDGGIVVGPGLRAELVPERFLLLSGATLDTVLVTAAEVDEWEREWHDAALADELADELAAQDEQLPGEWTVTAGRRATWSGGPANLQNIPRVRDGAPSAWDSPLEQEDQS